MIVVGVDENGLGPLLGPLVVTAVSLGLARYSPARHGALGRELGIDDSKATSAFGQMARAEGLALAAIEALSGRTAAHVDELFEDLLLDAPSELRRPCPAGSLAQCWSAPLALPCFGGELEQGRAALRALAHAGVQVLRAQSAVACAGALNTRLRAGQSRVEVDLELMERLVLDARRHADGDVRAICGMVGGIRNYREKMRHLSRHAVTAARASQGTLAFEVAEVGHVRFEIDADARHLPVALASMIGKYVRELWMTRQNRFYRERDPSLREVSGYHDPHTRGFVAQSSALRLALGVHDDCFARKNARDVLADMQLTLFEA